GDGRAVLRSSLREYVASEALAALGLPTTRALCLVGTGDQVSRDMFYNGDVRWERGAVVTRVAPCFVRFGSFQLPVSRGAGEVGLVRMLADWVVKYHYPHLQGTPAPYLPLLREVTHRTAHLVAGWQALGFVHGVLNTDNMSILGLTIDYGPFGFLGAFDPDWTPNLTDVEGRRYSYRNQPEAVQFNLVMFGSALCRAGLVGQEEAEGVLREYSEVLTTAYNARMAAKLGLLEYDRALCTELLKLMYEDDADFTNTFRALCEVESATTTSPASSSSSSSPTATSSSSSDSPTTTTTSTTSTSNVNSSTSTTPPHGLPAALAAALGGGGPRSEERAAAWRQWLGAYRAKLRSEGQPDAPRQASQRCSCPRFIPRQHLLQWAIEAAEGGEWGELRELMRVLERPYDEQPEAPSKYSQPPPREMVRP
ncbi:hypothetical protein Agub_g7911, partial [Astrephomene gubernaculifera]